MTTHRVINVERSSRRTMLAVSVGTLIEGYDSLLYGYFAVVFAHLFFPPGDPATGLLNTFAIFALGFAARPLGGIVFGHLGDRAGRRGALVLSILVMATATIGIGLLPTYATIGRWAPVLLLGCRLLQGFSVGGEYVGANILIQEQGPAGRRGRRVSTNQVASNIGIAAAGTTSLLLASVLSEAQLESWGWRLPFLFAVPLAVVGLYLRLRIPDSVAFQGAGTTRLRFPLGVALRRSWRGMLVYGGWWAMVGLGGFLLLAYMTSYLRTVVGMCSTEAFAANLAAVATSAIGALVGGVLVDRYPPWKVGVGCAVGIAVTVVPGFVILGTGTVAAAFVGQALWAACIGVSTTLGATLAMSQFPVEMRYTATGFAHNVAVTLFGTTAPYASTWLVRQTGNPLSPAWYLVLMSCVGAAIALFALRRLPVRATVRSAPPLGSEALNN